MPRAFLITNKRYNSAGENDTTAHSPREESPERRVNTAEDPITGNGCFGMTSETAVTVQPTKPASPKSPANLSRGPDCRSETPADYSFTRTSLATPWTTALPTAIYQQEEQVQPLGLIVPKSNNVPREDAAPPRRSIHTSVIRNLSSQFRQVPTTFNDNNAPVSCPLRPTTPGYSVQVFHRAPACHPPTLEESSRSTGNESSSDVDTASSPGSSVQDAHVCPECGKRYSTSSNLARHRQTHRSVTDKKARKCPHCEKVYVSIPAYSMHVRTHSQGCQCPYCGKCFSRPWLLQGHIRTHTGEKPFKCPICAKAFADKSNLRAHVQTHSTTKPYVCQRCGKAFALKSYLYKHEESSCMRLHRQHRAVRMEMMSTPAGPVALQIQA